MSERHEPMMSATCRAEQHQDQPDDITHVCRWLSHAGPAHNCICGHSWENTFEDRVIAGFAPALVQALQGHTEATGCTCGSTYETHQGPEPDCPAHGAVRAYNEAQAENGRLRAELAEARRSAQAALTGEQERGKSWAEKVLRVKSERDALKAAIERAREGLNAAIDAWTPEYEYNLDRARRKGYSQNEVAAEVYGDAIKAVNEALAALAASESRESTPQIIDETPIYDGAVFLDGGMNPEPPDAR